LSLASVTTIALASILLTPALYSAETDSLAIINAGVEQSEDAPSVAPDYRFLPGDYVYFTFQIAGFRVQSEERDEIRKISLSYEVTAQDAAGVPIAPAIPGIVKTELNPEDKNWVPKCRVSFLIPSFVAAGLFRVHVFVKDLVADSETAKDYPFRIGGVTIRPTASVSVENFKFFRKPGDQNALQVPAYSPGDTVYAQFNMVGFKTGPQNQYHLSYGLTVFRPDGKIYINDPKAAELQESTFYPARYLPGVVELTTSSTAMHGQYVIVLTVHDLVGDSNFEMKTAFSIE
jgi:hypothetical protein